MHGRRRRWTLAGLLLLLAAGGLVWTNWPRDAAVPASVEEALRAFRAHAAEAASPRPGLPQPGVYVYAIDGSESLDAVLDGTHRYAGQATVTVESSPCGVSERWQPLTARWTKSRICEQGGELRLAGIAEAHEFFDRSQLDTYGCRGAGPAPVDYRVGVSWRAACRGDSGVLQVDSRIVETGTVAVGGQRLAAVRIRSRAVVGGDNAGVSIQSEWRRSSDGLLLRRTVSSAMSVAVLGGGDYREDYSLELLSAAPRR
ncbi:MAG TPA: hypothetical protein VIL21_01255 [Solirubrobacterales bacterium]|jgi:hypothetical protein